MSQERVQKILARAGIASRRAAEALISAGRVTIDGRTISELGTQADPARQRIEVDGRHVGVEPLEYLVLHKPREVVSTLHDPIGRNTVAELVAGAGARVMPLGRLDYHTSGVLLFSNDGEFSRALLHPSTEVPRQYILKVKGPVERASLARLREGIVIDGRRTQPAEVRLERNEGDKVWLMVTLKEGRNRHVRRLAEHAGYQVMRLARLSFAGITSEGLAPGEWRRLTPDELTELKRLYGVPKSIAPHAAPAPRARKQAAAVGPRARKQPAAGPRARKEPAREGPRARKEPAAAGPRARKGPAAAGPRARKPAGASGLRAREHAEGKPAASPRGPSRGSEYERPRGRRSRPSSRRGPP
jgi:23S rRNA pseudouridine2605 synthase